VLDQILDLHRSGHTIIICTHDLEKVVAHAQRLVIMAKGRVVEDGSPAEIMRPLSDTASGRHVPFSWAKASGHG
jgi:biotin transport system ATP-binding protein